MKLHNPNIKILSKVLVLITKKSRPAENHAYTSSHGQMCTFFCESDSYEYKYKKKGCMRYFVIRFIISYIRFKS